MRKYLQGVAVLAVWIWNMQPSDAAIKGGADTLEFIDSPHIISNANPARAALVVTAPATVVLKCDTETAARINALYHWLDDECKAGTPVSCQLRDELQQ